MSSNSTARFLALALSIGSFTVLQSLLVPVLPQIQTDFHTDTAGATRVITAWFISAAVATPILGRVGDLIGRRRTFLIALGAIATGSILAALAPSLVVLIIARVTRVRAAPSSRSPSAWPATCRLVANREGSGARTAPPGGGLVLE